MLFPGECCIPASVRRAVGDGVLDPLLRFGFLPDGAWFFCLPRPRAFESSMIVGLDVRVCSLGGLLVSVCGTTVFPVGLVYVGGGRRTDAPMVRGLSSSPASLMCRVRRLLASGAETVLGSGREAWIRCRGRDDPGTGRMGGLPPLWAALAGRAGRAGP